MKKYAVIMFLIFGFVRALTAQVQINPTNQIKPGSKTRAQILVTDTLATTPDAQKGFFRYANLSDEVRRYVATSITNIIDTSVIYVYVGIEGVTPIQTPPLISNKAVNSSGEFYQYANGAWQLLGKFITAAPQKIYGNKNFQDSVTIGKGLTANGGINTNGNSTTAALTTKGVRAERDTTVASNFSLDGNYGTVIADCSLNNISLTLPDATNTANWIFQIKREDSAPNVLYIKNNTGATIYTVLSKYSLIFKNKNGVWQKL